MLTTSPPRIALLGLVKSTVPAFSSRNGDRFFRLILIDRKDPYEMQNQMGHV